MKIDSLAVIRWIILACIAVVIAFSTILAFVVARGTFGRPAVQIDASGATVVQQMRELQRLETAAFTLEKVIEAGTTGNVFQEILYGDRILLIAHGEAVAGIDFSAIDEKSVQVREGELTVKIPPAELFHVRLDSTRSRIYDRKLGLLSRGDKDLESQARAAAEESIRQAALEAGILESAQLSAEKQIKALFLATGFEKVTVETTSR